MSTSKQPRALRRALPGILAVVTLLAVTSAYFAMAPDATDFAPGKRVALGRYPGHDPSGQPRELAHAALVERGKYLTQAADCVVCHTAKAGSPFIGGRAFVLPFGTLYSTNITPDTETGIGSYTDAEFLSALQRGVARGRKRLYPAMPYPSYTQMSATDALAIKAFLFTLAPVRAPTPNSTLSFPFNQRVLISIWSALFSSDHRYEPNVDQSDAWNRGAYLVEAMEHCGECHTPRNVFFGLNNRKKFQGAVQAGWRAYNISADRDSGIGGWTDAELVNYLSMGHSAGRGEAAGPMGEAVDESMRHLASSDIRDMVTYLRTIPAITSKDLSAVRVTPASAQNDRDELRESNPRGQEIYEGVCVGCHGWTGVDSVIAAANLTGTRAVNDPTAINAAQTILHGVEHHTREPITVMPAFDFIYSDADIAAVANYVTARFGLDGARLSGSEIARLRSAD